jgi:hypothetical protein
MGDIARAAVRGYPANQYWSDEMASPLALVPSAQYVAKVIELLMNLTLPSQNRKLAPPGCMLLEFS